MKQVYWCFLLWINALLLWGQNPAETLVFARQQARMGQSASALKAYQRVLFFARDQYGTECYAQLATLFAREGDFTRSAYYFDLLYHAAPSDSLRNEAVLGKTGILILQKEYQKALIELLAIEEDVPEPFYARRQLFLGAAYFGARDFSASKAALFKLVPAGDERRLALETHFEKAEKAARKKPRTARVLSIFLPGAGQFYAGDVKNGVNSMLLNSGLALWFVAMVDAYSFPDAAITVIPWLFRYYAGGFQRAGKILEQKKEEKLRAQFRHMLDILQQPASSSK
jgi:hypothetical protein